MSANEYTEKAEQTHHVSWLTRGINPLGTGTPGETRPPKVWVGGDINCIVPPKFSEDYPPHGTHMGHVQLLPTLDLQFGSHFAVTLIYKNPGPD